MGPINNIAPTMPTSEHAFLELLTGTPNLGPSCVVGNV